MTAKKVAPQHKRVSVNYSIEQRIIDEVREKAELARISDSSLVNEALKKHFGFS